LRNPSRVARITRRTLVVEGGRLAAAVALAPALRLVPEAVDPRLRALDRAVRGPVLVRGGAAYERTRRIYNARFDAIRPLAVVQPIDARDVQAVVRWAAREGVRIAARSGGHSYGGYSTTPGVVVDLSRLAGVRAAGGRATVGAGARLGRVYARLADAGVAIPAGTCPSVGIGGLVLGGGYGFASRAWGLTCDALAEVDVVTADGRLLRCNSRQNADLFWACRGGGGGSFGIATRFVFRTRRVSSGSRFVATWPWDAVEEVVERFLRWAPTAPDALGAICRLAAGGSPSVQVFGQFLGDEEELKRVLRGLTEGLSSPRLTTAPSSWLDLVRRWGGCGTRSLEECSRPEPQAFAAASHYLARPLSRAGLAALRTAIESRGSESGAILIDTYGGAINRVAPAATAFVHRRMLASLQIFAVGDGSARAWTRATRDALRPHASGFAYQNYIDPSLRGWQRAYYGANLPRLARVKRKYDPKNLFRFAQSVPQSA
jgi:FAD/FMN-containing dehydrogenase